MERDPPPDLAREDKVSSPTFRVLARKLLAEMALYDPGIVDRIQRRHILKLQRR